MIVQILNPTAELLIPIRIPTKEAIAQIETHSVSEQTKASAHYNLKSYKSFFASYPSVYFGLSLQLTYFLFYLYFSI